MLISHKKRFVHIHIPKTAGTTIEYALNNSFCENDICSYEKHWTYINAADYISQLTYKINEYFIFSFVRNPWELAVSCYMFAKEKPAHLPDEYRNIINVCPTFEHFCFSGYLKLCLQIPYLIDTDDKIRKAVFIGRFEHLQRDWEYICSRLNIPCIKLQKKNTSKHEYYTDYYNDEMIKRVGEVLTQDIVHFGYKFN